MKTQRYLTMWRGFALCLSVFAGKALSAGDPDVLLIKGREAFYAAVMQESQVDTALAIFRELSEAAPAYRGLTTIYTGALSTLRGKHAFFPQKKYEYVQDGLRIMDQGLQQAPDDLEALFIYGMTCHHLPFFFGRKPEARKAFRRIVGLLEMAYREYDDGLVSNVVQFLRSDVPLTEKEMATVQAVETKVAGE